MNKAYLLLGGNIGDRKKVILAAIKLIKEKIGSVISLSSFYETAAWGIEEQNPFYNCAIIVETSKTPQQVMAEILEIEEMLGRKRGSNKWTERIIDIDILFFNEEIINNEFIKIPHPRIQERNFALIPLLEIAQNYIHPLFKKTVQELLAECTDKLMVKKI